MQSTKQVNRELLSCEGCVFNDHFKTYESKYRYLCALGRDKTFHARNDIKSDRETMGCATINPSPTVPCQARYTDEEMEAKLGLEPEVY